MRRVLVLTLLMLATAAKAEPGYELRSERRYSNEINDYVCSELVVGQRAVGWVFDATETPIGLIARVCEELKPEHEVAMNSTSVYGDVKTGWYVINLKNAKTRLLKLPHLGEFSNPAFCDGLAAYWGEAANSYFSLLVADIAKRKVIKNVPIGKLELETDDSYVLPPAEWSTDCVSATFNHQGSKTVLHAKAH